MPYIKQRAEPFSEVGRLLRGYGVTPTALAQKTGWSYGKAKTRCFVPGALTLSELEKIGRLFHIPMEEIRQSIKWGT